MHRLWRTIHRGNRKYLTRKKSESTNNTSTNRHTASKKSLNILTYAERNYLPFFRSIIMYNSNTMERHDKKKHFIRSFKPKVNTLK